MHLQQNTSFDLDRKVTGNVAQHPLHHVSYTNVAQYPLHHAIYKAAKFEVATSNDLGGDISTRKKNII